MKQRNRKPNNGWLKKHGFSALLYLMAAVIGLGLIGNAAAKYFQTSAEDSIVRAKWFYLTSNMEEGSPHMLNPDATSVSFTVGNHEDGLRFSEMDVKYSVSVQPALGDSNVESSTGTLEKGAIKEDTVTLKGLQPGMTYEITVIGEPDVAYAPSYSGAKYQKTLTFKIIVPNENALYQYFEKKDGYILLTVWAQGYQGDVTISYPSNVVPDNTSPIPVMQTATVGQESIVDDKTFGSSGYASAQYRFFITSGTPVAGDFKVLDKNNESAISKAPN